MNGLLWFHCDLRVSDHPGLREAVRLGGTWKAWADEPREPGTPAGRFRRECLENLRSHLSVLGIELRLGSHLDFAALLQEERKSNPGLRLFTSRRMNHRDETEFQNLTLDFPKDQIQIFDTSTLYPEADLPFLVQDLPKTFTPFQKRVEGLNPRIPAPLESPIPVSPGPKDPVFLNGKSMEFIGGESAGLLRLRTYLRAGGPAGHYAETRNGLLLVDDSSKLSPYLAQGCISARQVHQEILRHEQEQGVSKGTTALRYELQWRDYFKFLSLQAGARLFAPEGLKDRARESNPDRELFQKWSAGETGDPFLDANLRELKETGWMSNRGRQNVASHFAKIWKLPWLWGAEWFEKNLIDQDVETNQGNWMYLAGVGTDPRDRVFNVELQAQNYDPDGEYRRRWSFR